MLVVEASMPLRVMSQTSTSGDGRPLRNCSVPRPPSPCQAEHFSAKMGTPCAAVPSPDGSHLPSRLISMSHLRISAALTGLPRWGLGRLAPPRLEPAADADAMPSIQNRDRTLRIGMSHHPMRVHRPACDRVDVMIFESPNGRHSLQHTALGNEGGPRRL